MADVDTYTATPCGQSTGPQYEVPKVQADQMTFGHLGAVKIITSPDSFKCCTIDRSTVNSTPKEDANDVTDSGYPENDCPGCKAQWE